MPDRTPPSLTCPPDIHRHAEKYETSAIIHWDDPLIAMDGRDGRIKHVPSVISKCRAV